MTLKRNFHELSILLGALVEVHVGFAVASTFPPVCEDYFQRYFDNTFENLVLAKVHTWRKIE